MNYADGAADEATQYQMNNLYGNSALQAAIAASSSGSPYAMSSVKPRPIPVTARLVDDRAGANLSQIAAAGGVTIMGKFVTYPQLAIGAAVLAGAAYFMFGKKKRGRGR